MPSIQELREKRAGIYEQAKKLINLADTEKRDMASEEQEQFDRHMVDVDAIKVDIDRRVKLDTVGGELRKSAGRKTAPNDPGSDMPGEPENRAKPIEHEHRGTKVRFHPGTREHTRATDEYREQFRSYLSGGRETRAMMVGDQTLGGYMVPPQFSLELLTDLENEVWMRRLATVMPPLTTGASIGVMSRDTRPGDADWTPEIPASDLTADTAIRIGARELTPHLSTKYIEASQKFLRISSIDGESYIRTELAYVFGITEEQAFLTGDGAQQPLGVFAASADGVTTSQDVTAAAVNTIAGDDLINMVYDFAPQYQSGLMWVFNKDTLKIIRKLKDGEGQALWKIDGGKDLAGDKADTILGIPYRQSEYAPNTFTTGLYVAVLGNFARGYRIVDSLAMEVQRLDELKTLQNKVGFKASRETDGQPILADAFRRLKLA